MLSVYRKSPNTTARPLTTEIDSAGLTAYQLDCPWLAIAFVTKAMFEGVGAVGWASCAIVVSPRLQHPINPIPRLLVRASLGERSDAASDRPATATRSRG